jgi:hypothetical protein
MLIFLILVTAVYSAKSYRVLSRGSVRDNSTNLIWTRCSLSTDNKPIYSFQCNGEKKLYSWNEAVDVCSNLIHEGRSDWRLPSIKELQTIIFYYHYVTGDQNYSQTVEDVFPNTVTQNDIQTDFSAFWQAYCVSNTCHLHYWSSTPFDANTSWAVNFNSGGVQLDTNVKFKSVRCVAGP